MRATRGAWAAILAVVLFAHLPSASAETTSKSAAKPQAKTAHKKPVYSREAEKHYRQARALERKGDERGALVAYLAAGDAGHGLAQRRLGEIYEKGNSATKRDYDIALRWYEKARAQGIEIPKPITLQRGH